MYTINNFYIGCKLVGNFIKNGKVYKIYQLPDVIYHQGFTANQLFDFFKTL